MEIECLDILTAINTILLLVNFIFIKVEVKKINNTINQNYNKQHGGS